jgi:hypothetical protein
MAKRVYSNYLKPYVKLEGLMRLWKIVMRRIQRVNTGVQVELSISPVPIKETWVFFVCVCIRFTCEYLYVYL